MSTAGPALTGRFRFRRAGRALALETVALVAGSLIVLGARWGSDWPAQQFRAWIAARYGLSSWTSQWYGGHPLWGYSVLYPALAAVLGAAGTGLFALVLGAWFGSRLAPPGMSRSRTVAFQAGVLVTLLECLLIGQLPFLLGAGFAAAAVVAARSRVHPAWIALAAALCSLSSPLVGVFLIVAVPALAAVTGWRRCGWLAPALLGAVVSAVAGGASGPDPFTAWQFAQVVLFCALLVALRPVRRAPAVRFAGVYVLVATGSFAVPNPVGGNILRLGMLVALPMTVALVPAASGWFRRTVCAVLVAAAVMWPGQPVLSALRQGSSDPSRNSSYYTGLLGFLRSQDPLAGRLEIPFTRGHWESLYVATAFPIARGWERQTDLQYNTVLYRPLTAGAYRRWLDENSVALVALPTESMDRGGAAEQALLHNPPAYLSKVWADAHWTVWRVQHPRPIVAGSATLLALKATSLRLRFVRPGSAVVHVRYSRWWQAVSDDVCVEAAHGGWLRVHARSAGVVELATRFSGSLVVADPDCASG